MRASSTACTVKATTPSLHLANQARLNKSYQRNASSVGTRPAPFEPWRELRHGVAAGMDDLPDDLLIPIIKRLNILERWVAGLVLSVSSRRLQPPLTQLCS